MTDQLFRTAMHEAGHAVMALDVGAEVYSATIVQDGNRLGDVSYEYEPVGRRDRFFVTWAGPAAEIWAGIDDEDAWHCGMGSDMDKIEAYADHLVESGEWRKDEVRIYMNALSRIANKRLEPLRPRIEKLAHELMARKTMTGDEIKEFLQ